ncbi:Uncharacterised protein [Dermatophilus congolensis]|uniref:Uncharacterized protein n=1 Tax=Dermatophilus congolensis TaxID=1863 RepID=A0A239V783_9MICO|nr:Uncharacterised protein [Dermatophilus congolensis]
MGCCCVGQGVVSGGDEWGDVFWVDGHWGVGGAGGCLCGWQGCFGAGNGGFSALQHGVVDAEVVDGGGAGVGSGEGVAGGVVGVGEVVVVGVVVELGCFSQGQGGAGAVAKFVVFVSCPVMMSPR